MIKSKDDFVKLVNISKDGENELKQKHFSQDVVFAHDSVEYSVPKGGSVILRREVAEHGVKRTHSYAHKMHVLKIEELPENQRNSRVIAVSPEIEDLKSENERLKAQLAAAQDRKPDAQPEQPQHRKLGRPSSK